MTVFNGRLSLGITNWANGVASGRRPSPPTSPPPPPRRAAADRAASPTPPAGDFTTSQWDFGDGGTSTAGQPDAHVHRCRYVQGDVDGGGCGTARRARLRGRRTSWRIFHLSAAGDEELRSVCCMMTSMIRRGMVCGIRLSGTLGTLLGSTSGKRTARWSSRTHHPSRKPRPWTYNFGESILLDNCVFSRPVSRSAVIVVAEVVQSGFTLAAKQPDTTTGIPNVAWKVDRGTPRTLTVRSLRVKVNGVYQTPAYWSTMTPGTRCVSKPILRLLTCDSSWITHCLAAIRRRTPRRCSTQILSPQDLPP